MAAVKDQAIVLRRLDYSETSQVLVFLTREHGLQRLIAKGIKRSTKKKYATGIDLLERGRLVFLISARGEGLEPHRLRAPRPERKALQCVEHEMRAVGGCQRERQLPPLRVSAIEQGRHNPSVGLALRLAQILGVTVEELFGLGARQREEGGRHGAA